MGSLWQIHLKCDALEVRQALTMRGRTQIKQVLAQSAMTLESCSAVPPDRVRLMVRLPGFGSGPPDLSATAEAIRAALGFTRGEDEVRPADEDESVLPEREFRGAAGEGRLCGFCGGVDGRHFDTCPDRSSR
jgi:hypothetical protein